MNEQTQITFNAVQGRLTDLELQLLSAQSQIDLLTQEIEKLKKENEDLKGENSNA